MTSSGNQSDLPSMTLPDKLTFFRILLTPIIIGIMVVQPGNVWAWLSLLLYIVAAVTDFLDGFLARKMNIMSDFGALLDPLADKILVGSVFIIFVEWGELAGWAVALIISRELMVTGLRAFAASQNVTLAADKSGKFKTILQIVLQLMILLKVALMGLAAESGIHPVWNPAIAITCWATVIITTWSGATYLYNNRNLYLKKSSTD